MNTALLEQIVRLERQGRRFAVVAVVETIGSVPGKVGARMVVFPDGSQLGTVGGAGLEETAKRLAVEALGSTGSRRGGLHRFDLARQKPGGLDSVCGGNVTLFIEIMNPRPHLILFGGGHVGLAMARLCDQLEYRYTVCDTRPEFAASERFPGAVETVVGDAGAFFRDRDLTPYSHIYVLGHSHHDDAGTLAEALRCFDGPIGLIGSIAKRRDLQERLVAAGIATDEFDRRVTCPIGLPLGAETPAELAVSILAEVVRDYRHGDE
jgi:xanthine dehydrogenase accessory factor